jgi:aryl-alcohol dehydrogenase-like predicted oxidoreductase
VKKRRLGIQGPETSALGLGCTTIHRALELTVDELRDLEAVVPKGAAAGDRYPDMSPVNR